MATYKVLIDGTLHSDYGYVTINNKKVTTTGLMTYTSKPTISVYVTSNASGYRSKCYVNLNGTKVKSGYGSYNLSKDTILVFIKIAKVYTDSSQSWYYFTADIFAGGGSGSAASGGGHTANIGGVTREIEGSTVKSNGVGCEVESGLSLVGGVAKEISFGPTAVVMTIMTAPNSTTETIKIGSQTYRNTGDYEIDIGTEIVFSVMSSGPQSPGSVYLNEELVLNDNSYATTSYALIAEADVAVICGGGTRKGNIRILTS